MEDEQLSFTLQEHVMYSIPSDHLNGSCFTPIAADFDHELFNGKCLDNGVSYEIDTSTTVRETDLFAFSNAPVFVGTEEYHEEDNEDWTAVMETMMRPRRDRSKTLVSERRRRGQMKEKLYELRSLVPNITKMDKASIIADAIIYIQDLQKQAKNLTDEIAKLNFSMKEDTSSQFSPKKNTRTSQVSASANLIRRNVRSVLAHELGEGRFYVKVECDNGDEVASSLYTMVDTLMCFTLESSDFASTPEKLMLVLVLNLNVAESTEEMNAYAVKLWIISGLIRQGFEFEKLIA